MRARGSHDKKPVGEPADFGKDHRMEKPCLSIVVPCYNEESVLGAFYEEITKTAEEIREIVNTRLAGYLNRHH